jgi:hypothetical protein
MCLAGCSKGNAATDANQPTSASQAAPAVPPKPYLAPAAIYEALGGEYAPCRQKVEGATVDWSRGVIVASGSAKATAATPQERIKAQRAAEQTAIRNAVLAGSGITVDSRGKFSDLRKGTVDVEAVATGREILSSTWEAAAQTTTATVSLPMYGLAGVVRLDGVPVEKPEKKAPLEARDPVKEDCDLIVIDARGAPLAPCLSPRIVDEKGQVLFDASEIPLADLAGRHVAVYVEAPRAASRMAANSEPARSLPRRITLVAGKPLGIDQWVSKSEITLNGQGQKMLFRHADAAELLKAGRLVIIVGESEK